MDKIPTRVIVKTKDEDASWICDSRETAMEFIRDRYGITVEVVYKT
jgi:hypothetical protein